MKAATKDRTTAGPAYDAAATPVTLNINVYDFTITTQAPFTLSVVPGAVATYTYALAPLGGQYPGATVTFAVTGCPTSSTCTVTPTTVAQAAGPQTLTLTVTTPPAIVMNRMRQTATWAIALLMPLFVLRKSRRKLSQAMTMMLLLFVLASGLTGCAADYGFFGQPVQTYTITVSATSGGITHTAAPVTLQVQ